MGCLPLIGPDAQRSGIRRTTCVGLQISYSKIRLFKIIRKHPIFSIIHFFLTFPIRHRFTQISRACGCTATSQWSVHSKVLRIYADETQRAAPRTGAGVVRFGSVRCVAVRCGAVRQRGKSLSTSSFRRTHCIIASCAWPRAIINTRYKSNFWK